MTFLLGKINLIGDAACQLASSSIHNTVIRAKEKFQTATKFRLSLLFYMAYPILACNLYFSLFTSGYLPGAYQDVQTKQRFASEEHLLRGSSRNNSAHRLDQRLEYDNNDIAHQSVANFMHALRSGSMSRTETWPHLPIVPFIVRDGKLFCRSIHREQLQDPKGTVVYRSRQVAEMIQIGLDLYQNEVSSHGAGAVVPLMLMGGDHYGCNVAKQRDLIGFPRLTWSLPSPKHGEDWCRAIPATSYAIWTAFKGKTRKSWENEFLAQAANFPWSSKINKAVWRGSTTSDPTQFSGRGLNETPRGMLVQMSMEKPKLIDAAFVKFSGSYESRESELLNQTIVTERMPSDHFMKYKAIIDIDGMNWSSRFAMLLCMNSVVIKIDPDYVEYFYHELEPMVHYVPASLKNLSRVVAHVLDNENEDEMKAIVDSANNWCRREMTKDALIKAANTQLKSYDDAFSFYVRKHIANETIIPDDVESNLVECVI